MPISAKQLEKFNYNNIFIETGTGGGLGTLAAVEAGYKTIHTIEFYDTREKIAKKRLKEYDFVNIHKGDSDVVLGEILVDINESATFWLDAHTGRDEPLVDPCPLLKELDVIRNHHIKSHTILIDDIRYFRKGLKIWHSITLDQIIGKIHPSYNIHYIDGFTTNDILVAEIKDVNRKE